MEKWDDLITDKMLNMVLDEVDDLLVIRDSDQSIIWVNRSAQKILGICPDKVVGKSCYSIFGRSTGCDKCGKDCMAAEQCHRCACSMLGKDGIEYRCLPVPYHKNGKLLFVLQHIKPVMFNND